MDPERESLLRVIVNSQNPSDYDGLVKQRQKPTLGVQDELTSFMKEEERFEGPKLLKEKLSDVERKTSSFWLIMKFHLLLIGLSANQFAFGIQEVACGSVLIPLQVKDVAGDREKGEALGITLLAGSVISLVLPPILGAWSDYLNKRKFFMMIGILFNFAGLVGLGFCQTLSQIAGVNVIATIGTVTYVTVFSAAFSEQVAKENYGTACGIMGAINVAGFLTGSGIGALVPYIGTPGSYALIASISFVFCSVTLFFILEEPSKVHVASEVLEESEEKRKESRGYLSSTLFMFHALTRPNFALVCFSRFFVELGVTTVNEFLIWWVRDVIPLHRMQASSEAAVLLTPVTIMSLISAILVGKWSDRVKKRKIFLVTSSFLMSVLILLTAFIQSFEVAIFVFSFFGLSLGGFIALEYTIVFDVLPEPEHAGRDLGVFHIFSVLPQLFAAPIAGILLDNANRYGARNGLSHFGYVVVFLLSGFYFIVATILFACLRLP